ncbi:hypothetical protein [Allokutzneria albata]|uniref:Lipoprotein n=1 Tax=Allokutzneria albata TaxID=211114 RepID=A0A1G9SF47_ALLAB|nr:hypothetical protein [Allokutzneria albata]SDM34103.1 hypothetical protein SAMN04489726_1128 [Allokutzneria albata]
MGVRVVAVAFAAVALIAGACGQEPKSADVLYEAEQVLLRDCMRRNGFEFWIAAKAEPPRAFPYVLDDPAWARKHGYGLDGAYELERAREDDPNQRYFRGLDLKRRNAALTALNGDTREGLRVSLPNGATITRSDRGCTSEAQRVLYEDLPTWYRVMRLTDSLNEHRHSLVLQDERYRAAIAPWARCMRDSGHDIAGPAESRSTLPPRGAPGAGEAERRLAEQEASCALSSGLAATARQLDEQYRRRIQDTYRADIETRQRLESAARARAQDIVAAAS